jgi:hypothetical protein
VSLPVPLLARGVSLDAFAPQGTRQLRTLGLQLYTVRDAMAKDVEGTAREDRGGGLQGSRVRRLLRQDASGHQGRCSAGTA